jgi:serine/threonine protein kinase
MPPEQILGMPLDGRADLYALGCCAWWLLAGRELFRRDLSEAALQHAHLHDPPPSLGGVMRGWCPAELERVIEACLAKDPERRPSDARALAAMVRAIPIPDEHAWTDARAAAWWRDYRPPAPAPTVATAEVQRIGPGRTD